MTGIIDTIQNSINELIGNSITILPGLISALIIVALTRYGAEFTHNLAKKVADKTIKSTSLRLLFLKATYIITWIVGIVIASIIAFPGLRLGDIIATLGLGSVAVGFAFQDIFKNFLAGILILLEEPFVIQDQIQVDDHEGTVENINIRTTEIKTYQGEKILIPNSTVFTSAIKIKTAFPSRRTDLMVGVDYNTSLPQAKAILEQIINTIGGVTHEPAPEVDLVAFNDSSIDLVVRYWTDSRQADVRRIQTKAIAAIKQAFDNEDIVIPYPIRTVYHFNQEKFNDYLPPAQS
ncbi:mechanosensitive ion channel family protein [Cyanobacterium stanieri LEGE 03274]|uniref:Mechanosensitive ion channel family protein n=1 Tax=Cyanobacterium stanieri LEGE 03274 TaxID=1828756 RepID=A0ABR9V1X7_9CHRO|nr:mechanosensitive ion channel family protein [Cyanobacterium stanieri]MBE9221888.1 mechanosensitive ion channel family protein [Cyanobacterium stanieri LEGE 03274]